MLIKLIETAETKAGSQKQLAAQFNVRYHRFGDYKAGRRIPDDVLIGQLAEYVGLNPIETILKCKLELETDKEKVSYWNKWFNNWYARRELNPRPSASETDTLSN